MVKNKRAKVKRNNLKPLYAYLKVSSVGDEKTWDFSGLRGIDIEKNIINDYDLSEDLINIIRRVRNTFWRCLFSPSTEKYQIMAPENYDSGNHEVVMKDLSLLAIRFIPAYLSQLQNFDLQKIFTEVNSGRWHFQQQPDVQRETNDCWSHLFNLLTGDVRHLSPNGQETKLDTAIGADLCRFTMAIGHYLESEYGLRDDDFDGLAEQILDIPIYSF